MHSGFFQRCVTERSLPAAESTCHPTLWSRSHAHDLGLIFARSDRNMIRTIKTRTAYLHRKAILDLPQFPRGIGRHRAGTVGKTVYVACRRDAMGLLGVRPYPTSLRRSNKVPAFSDENWQISYQLERNKNVPLTDLPS